MKTLELCKSEKFDDRDILIGLMGMAPKAGYSVAQLRSALKCIDVLESAETTVEFEDADWDFLKQRVMSQQWAVAKPELLAMIDKIEAVK